MSIVNYNISRRKYCKRFVDMLYFFWYMEGVMNTVIKLPQVVSAVLEELAQAGYDAYVVGGCVRDSVMGSEPKDYDITTAARPEEVMAVFSDDRIFATGLKHGTVTLVREGENIEITTFRTDGEYTDSRHPDSVSFSRKLSDDLSRRDFTCNAMAYNPREGIIDIFGGLADIEAGRIVTVGDADCRFGEDALRMMRALRFSSVLGFEIEEKTADAIHRLRERLNMVSGERLAAELRKLLCGKGCVRIVREFHDVLSVFIDGFSDMYGFDQRSIYHDRDLMEHTLAAVENTPPVFELRFAALMHDIGKLDCFTIGADGHGHFLGHPSHSCERAGKVIERLHLSNRERDEILDLIRLHDIRFGIKESTVRRYVGIYGEQFMLRLTMLMRADALAHSADSCSYRENMAEIEKIEQTVRGAAQRDCLRVTQLDVNGNDIAQLGCPRGPELGRILEKLLELVTDDRIENTRDALLEAARAMIGRNESD